MSTSHRFTPFTQNEGCPLTPALRHLLETSLYLGTTNNKTLADYLYCSEETIKSGFRRISVTLETHSRTETLLKAMSCGWISRLQ